MLKKPYLFCFGMGYCAATLAEELSQEGWQVAGTSQSESLDSAIHTFSGNAPMEAASNILADVTHILISIPPNANHDPAFIWHKEDIIKLKSLQWIGYLSTTGVYGNTNGKMVDETAPTMPSSKRSQNRLKVETQWLNLFNVHDLPIHVFRLPGIYGPGRSALDQVAAGQAKRIDKPGQKFSRIHVVDIVNTIKRSIASPNPGRIYNVCDNEAASPADVTAYACKLLGVPEPVLVPFEVAAEGMSPMALTFWLDNRRVDNTRIKSELGVQLNYPTYRDGLKAILACLTKT